MKRLRAIGRRLCSFSIRALKRLRIICRHLWAIGCRWTLIGACGVSGFALANLGFIFPIPACAVLAYASWLRLRKWRGSGWLYGTAHVASFLDVCRAGWLSNNGGLVIGRASFLARPTRGQALGYLLSPFTSSLLAMTLVLAAFWRIGGRRLIRINDYVHVAVFGATGSGKGVGIVIPTLLSNFDSCVVCDPKSELFRITSRHREKHGHTVLRLDPFHLAGPGSDALNPLDFIDDLAADFPEQVNDLTDSLIIVSPHEINPHFPESAKIVLSYIIAFVCAVETNPEDRTLQTVRHILKSRVRFAQAIVAMQQVTTHGGLIAGMGHQLTFYEGKELAGILTTITRFTAWLDSPTMKEITSSSTFDPKKFRTCKATLYLILPAKRLKTLAPLNRMWISTIMRALIEGVPDERRKILFILDEAGHIGPMQILEDAVTLLRGYGIRLMFFFQSAAQLSEVFGERGSRFLDNIGTQLYMGVNAYESAKAISDRCGDATVLMQTLNDSTSFSKPTGGFSKDSQKGSVSRSRSINYAEMSRALYRPDEILRMSPEVGLLFHQHMPVVPIRLLKSYKDREFRRGRSAPYRGGVGLRAGLLAATMLFASFGLLAVALNPPRPPKGHFVFTEPEAFPPRRWTPGAIQPRTSGLSNPRRQALPVLPSPNDPQYAPPRVSGSRQGGRQPRRAYGR